MTLTYTTQKTQTTLSCQHHHFPGPDGPRLCLLAIAIIPLFSSLAYMMFSSCSSVVGCLLPIVSVLTEVYTDGALSQFPG